MTQNRLDGTASAFQKFKFSVMVNVFNVKELLEVVFSVMYVTTGGILAVQR